MRRKILFVSHVLPFPGITGQELRVRYMLESATPYFDVDFLTYAQQNMTRGVHERLAAFGCRPVVLESCISESRLQWWRHSVAAGLFVLRTGLKTSNYSIGKVELSGARIRSAVNPTDYSLVLYEYFHAAESLGLFQVMGVPGVLDTHNVLWKAMEQQMKPRYLWSRPIRKARLARYRQWEEDAWRRFDAVIAINRSEEQVIQAHLRPSQRLFYAPMGTDLSRWRYCWEPAQPVRIAYYGALGGRHNEAAAMRCHNRILPQIRQRFPDAELWLVGSNPSTRLRGLAADPRVKVTGFVERVQDILSTMSLILCPWSGTYGFRSRVVEAMALGVPVVATPEAVDGMELEPGRGILLAISDTAMAAQVVDLLLAPHRLAEQSRLARLQIERLYSLANTYERLVLELDAWLNSAPKPGYSTSRAHPSR